VLTATQLDNFAAAFTVLGNVQLQPATASTRHRMATMLSEWPLPASELTSKGIEAIRLSTARHESEDAVKRDQDLLYGITATAKVPPFESVHRSEEHLVFDQQTLEVREFYRSQGLQAPRLNREPDDHIGLELNFLAHCCVRALTALEQGTESAAERHVRVAGDFTRDHVRMWAPAMLDAAADAAETQWVRGMELLTLGALSEWDNALANIGYGITPDFDRAAETE
jgi:TorA maturation chaperone TorD